MATQNVCHRLISRRLTAAGDVWGLSALSGSANNRQKCKTCTRRNFTRSRKRREWTGNNPISEPLVNAKLWQTQARGGDQTK
jgi:hypothetical protein